MDIQNITNKETATQNEQQLKSKQDIIKDIINLLAENNLSIDNAKEILYITSKKLYQQPVKFFS